MENKIQAGDLLFVWDKNLIGEGIEWVTHGAAHVAVFVGEDKLYEAQGGRTLGGCDLSFYQSDDKVARLEVWTDPTWTNEQRAMVLDVAKKYENTPYDYKVIGWELLHFELGVDIDFYDNKDTLDCSEFANALGLEFGKKWADMKHPAPADLLNGGVLVKKIILK